MLYNWTKLIFIRIIFLLKDYLMNSTSPPKKSKTGLLCVITYKGRLIYSSGYSRGKWG